MRIIFDHNNLKRTVVNNLNDTISNIKDSINVINSMDIPSDFRYNNYIYSLKDDLNEINRDNNNIIDWIDKSNNSFENVRSELNLKVQSIGDFVITKVDTFIK